MATLDKLSPQELAAIHMYNTRVQRGDTEETAIWADDFTAHMFYGHKGTVIDIGCGLGRVVPILDDYGITSYMGIDPSVEHVRYCQERFPHHHFLSGEVRQLGSREFQDFGGFLMMNILMHTPKKELGSVLQAVRAGMQSGAVGLLNSQHPSISSLVSEEARKLTLSFYQTEEILEALVEGSFRAVNLREHEHGCMYHVIAV